MTIYSSPVCSCIICHKQYSQKGIHTHYERAHGTSEQRAKYSDGHNGCYHLEEYRDTMRKAKGFIQISVTTFCECCGIEFTYDSYEGYPIKKTCSKSCGVSLANKGRKGCGYEWTDERRQEASDRSKKLWEDEEYSQRVLNGNRRFTSKNETIIRDFFINEFADEQWTFGGSLAVQDERIVRDLYSDKLKICFEYDGIWHFKDIHGQLAKKQKKDRLLEEWCIDNGYSLVRLDEDQFNHNSVTMLREIFHSITEPTILKIGDRY